MYHPADRGEAPLTEEERALRLKGLTKEISRSKRFPWKTMDANALKDDDDNVAVLYTPVGGATPVPVSYRDGDKLKRYDLEDLRKTPNIFYVESEKKAENGYSFVKTPSPAPGVDESPFITWGEIEGTPLRFRELQGSSERVKDVSTNHHCLHQLEEGAPSPSTRRYRLLRQKFMRNAIAKSSRSIDESLRASYRSGSPGLSTPKASRSVSRLARDGSMGSRSPSVERALIHHGNLVSSLQSRIAL
ncbi:UNVERIFIED_CONTAM: Splicing factor ESS-2 [Sesamum radiatum]|uniref:Splicing factor ESS-2 n=1 Tax=Sesamum radiatum TaxID=300843 RepID=A0AAW2KM99_SESRA